METLIIIGTLVRLCHFFTWYFIHSYNSIKKLNTLFKNVISEHEETEDLDILGNMLKAINSDQKAHLSEEEFNSNLFILFVAGHETTANALSWGIYELGKNPDIQQKLYDVRM
eukprot:TRINITY_DN5141_c0_g3_i1.p2 TRINITY_DN5141_c0_g3~~TRINITY_DN5141_c0_g3_i1.p2  ORF type:complete len:113 (-),score=20.70 TRINITY_DN5141_c0_g3_i1:466-804(-)